MHTATASNSLAPIRSTNDGRMTLTRKDQYLSFAGGRELCALPINRVEEIIDPVAITVVPQMPSCVLGIANIRGEVVPIVDFNTLIGASEPFQYKRRCLILVTVTHDEHPQRIALQVAQVDAVFDLADSQREQAPSFGIAIPDEFISGMAKQNERFIALIDPDELLQLDRLTLAQN